MMKERMKQDLERTFAAAPDTQKNRELKEEILSNLYEKYQDCIDSGMSEDEAYRVTVSGIGDLSGLFEQDVPSKEEPLLPLEEEKASAKKKLFTNIATAFAVVLYILCVIPLILSGSPWAVILMFAMIAAATGLLIFVGGTSPILVPASLSEEQKHTLKTKRIRRSGILSGAVMLYILCVCPVIAFANHEALGVSLMFLMIAVATAGLILRSTLLPMKEPTKADPAWDSDASTVSYQGAKKEKKTPLGIFFSILSSIYWALVLIAYFVYSFYTGKWFLSWLIFVLAALLYAALHGVVQVVVGRRRTGAIVKIVICSILLFALLSPAIVLGNINPDSFRFSTLLYDDSDYTVGGVTLPPEAAISNLDIEWSYGTVLVEYWDNPYICATESAEKELTDSDQMRHRLWNNTLSIKSQPSMFGFFISSPEKHLTVYLPRGTELSEFRISAASGAVTVNGISAKKANLDSASATLSLPLCSFDILDVDTASGDLSFQGSARRINLDTASGDLFLTLQNAPEEMEIDTASGNADLLLPATLPGFRLEFDTASGKLEIPAETHRYGDEMTYGDGSSEINMDSASGNLKIRLS